MRRALLQITTHETNFNYKSAHNYILILNAYDIGPALSISVSAINIKIQSSSKQLRPLSKQYLTKQYTRKKWSDDLALRFYSYDK